MNEKVLSILKGFLWGLIICGLMAFCQACKTTKVIERQTDSLEIATLRARLDSMRHVTTKRDSVIIYRDHTDSLTRTTARRDSVYIRDSIIIVKDTAGNIIYIERNHTGEAFHTQDTNSALISLSNDILEHYQAVSDSLAVLRAQRDSLERVQTDTHIIEKTTAAELTPWQKLCIRLTPWLAGILALFVLAFVLIYKYGGKIFKT